MLLHEADRTRTLVGRKDLRCLARGEGLSETEETKIQRLSFTPDHSKLLLSGKFLKCEGEADEMNYLLGTSHVSKPCLQRTVPKFRLGYF